MEGVLEETSNKKDVDEVKTPASPQEDDDNKIEKASISKEDDRQKEEEEEEEEEEGTPATVVIGDNKNNNKKLLSNSNVIAIFVISFMVGFLLSISRTSYSFEKQQQQQPDVPLFDLGLKHVDKPSMVGFYLSDFLRDEASNQLIPILDCAHYSYASDFIRHQFGNDDKTRIQKQQVDLSYMDLVRTRRDQSKKQYTTDNNKRGDSQHLALRHFEAHRKSENNNDDGGDDFLSYDNNFIPPRILASRICGLSAHYTSHYIMTDMQIFENNREIESLQRHLVRPMFWELSPSQYTPPVDLHDSVVQHVIYDSTLMPHVRVLVVDRQPDGVLAFLPSANKHDYTLQFKTVPVLAILDAAERWYEAVTKHNPSQITYQRCLCAAHFGIVGSGLILWGSDDPIAPISQRTKDTDWRITGDLMDAPWSLYALPRIVYNVTMSKLEYTEATWSDRPFRFPKTIDDLIDQHLHTRIIEHYGKLDISYVNLNRDIDEDLLLSLDPTWEIRSPGSGFATIVPLEKLTTEKTRISSPSVNTCFQHCLAIEHRSIQELRKREVNYQMPPFYKPKQPVYPTPYDRVDKEEEEEEDKDDEDNLDDHGNTLNRLLRRREKNRKRGPLVDDRSPHHRRAQQGRQRYH